jgi:ankyrin repeat protein
MDYVLKAMATNNMPLFHEAIDSVTNPTLLEQYLYFACVYEHEPIVRHLLHLGVCPNHVNYHTFPLRAAARKGSLRIAEALVENGAWLELPYSLETTCPTPPIIEACENDRTEMVQWLLSKKANLHTRNERTRETPLHIACRRNNLSLVNYILAQDTSGLIHKDVEKQTVLDITIKQFNLPMLEVLFTYGMSSHVRLCCSVLRDALNMYTSDPLFEIVQIFVRHGVSPTLRYMHMLIHFIQAGDETKVKYLLEHTTDVNATAYDGNAPLHVACRTSASMVARLLPYRPKLEMQDAKGDTPLCVACMKGDTAIVRLLLKHGAKGYLNSEQSSLLKSVCFGRVDIVVLLFQYGASPLQTFEGSTLRQIADSAYVQSSPKMVNLLTDAENAALSTPFTVERAFFTRNVLDISTWSHLLPHAAHHTFHHLLRDEEMDQRACYMALHHGENDTLQRYRAGERVWFSIAPIRCLGRSFATRQLRKSITSYLVFPHHERLLWKHAREMLNVHGNAMPL